MTLPAPLLLLLLVAVRGTPLEAAAPAHAHELTNCPDPVHSHDVHGHAGAAYSAASFAFGPAGETAPAATPAKVFLRAPVHTCRIKQSPGLREFIASREPLFGGRIVVQAYSQPPSLHFIGADGSLLERVDVLESASVADIVGLLRSRGVISAPNDALETEATATLGSPARTLEAPAGIATADEDKVAADEAAAGETAATAAEPEQNSILATTAKLRNVQADLSRAREAAIARASAQQAEAAAAALALEIAQDAQGRPASGPTPTPATVPPSPSPQPSAPVRRHRGRKKSRGGRDGTEAIKVDVRGGVDSDLDSDL